MDAEYLKASVGDVLATGIAETVLMRPDDPVDFLAQFLLKTVADEAEAQVVAAEKEEAKKVKARKDDADAVKAAAAEQKEAAIQMQVLREDKRLQQLLEAATDVKDVYSAVLGYLRTRTGASAYIMATDLPQKALQPPPPPVEVPAEVPADEGAPMAEAEAAEPEPEPEPEPEADPEAEPEPPKPKHIPLKLSYEAATANDTNLLSGKSLTREAPPAEEEEADEPPPPPPPGAGASFDAIDAFLKTGVGLLHLPRAIEDKRVKFWYIPRTGGFVAAPVPDWDGDVQCVLALDLLGLDRPFTEEELILIQQAGHPFESPDRYPDHHMQAHPPSLLG